MLQKLIALCAATSTGWNGLQHSSPSAVPAQHVTKRLPRVSAGDDLCCYIAGGHVISAAVGCAFRLALRDARWVAAPLSMATSLLAMQLTRTVHPPGQLKGQFDIAIMVAHWTEGLISCRHIGNSS